MISEEAKLREAMLDAFDEAFDLWRKKQADYGPNNIAQAGEIGVALRANDKVQRLRTLLNLSEAPMPMLESIRDSWLDLINYAAMGLLLRDGKWPQAAEAELSAEAARCRHCGKDL